MRSGLMSKFDRNISSLVDANIFLCLTVSSVWFFRCKTILDNEMGVESTYPITLNMERL